MIEISASRLSSDMIRTKLPSRLFRNALRRRAWVGSLVPLLLLVALPAQASVLKSESEGRSHRAVRSAAATQPKQGAVTHVSLHRLIRRHPHFRHDPVTADVSSDEVAAPQVTEVIDHGIASWYGGRHNGRLTSSGVRFDDTKLTAAHAWLPLGSRVRVTSQATGSSVIVTINDRQRSARRVIDLSKAAADELGMRGRGITMVTITHG